MADKPVDITVHGATWKQTKNNVTKSALYANQDENGVRHRIGEVYVISISEEEAKQIGAAYGPSIQSEVRFINWTDGRYPSEEVSVGTYANAKGVVCGYSSLHNSKGEFTQKQVNIIGKLVEDNLRDYFGDADFEIAEQAIDGIQFAEEDEPTKPLIRKDRGMFYKDTAIDLDTAAQIYNNLSVEDAAQLSDEELSDLALAAQEAKEMGD